MTAERAGSELLLTVGEITRRFDGEVAHHLFVKEPAAL